MVCRVCGGGDISEKLLVREMMFGTRKPYIYLSCSGCGTLQIETPIIDSELLYPSNYYSFNFEKSTRWQNKIKIFLYKKTVAHYLGKSGLIGRLYASMRPNAEASSISSYLTNNSKILDIGCGTGIFIKALASLGYQNPIGIDPYIQTNINGSGYSIFKASISEFSPENHFDIVTMHHSFEHMPNPDEVLRKVRNILAEGGVCLIRIPISDSYAFDHYRENWVQIDAPRHIFLHTLKSMTILAERNGLKIIRIIDDSTDFQIIGSEQYLKDIALIEPGTYYRPLYKQILGIGKHAFDRKRIKAYKKLALDLKMADRGDQKLFVLVKQ